MPSSFFVSTMVGKWYFSQILEAHRTTYGVESKLGEGSTFWFEMRVEAVMSEDGEELSAEDPVETAYISSDSADT